MVKTRNNYHLFMRKCSLVLLDCILIATAAFLALYIRFDFMYTGIEPAFLANVKAIMPLQITATLIIFGMFRIYSSLWEYASVQELGNIVVAAAGSTLVQMLTMIMTTRTMPRSYYPFYFVLLVMFVGTTRITYRFLRRKKYNIRSIQKEETAKKRAKNVMIVGAGAAGTALIREIQTSQYVNDKICCAIDDDKAKHGKYIRGVQITGNRDDIVACAEKYHIDKILVALPRLSAKELKPILEICHETNCEIQKVPGIYQLVNGEVNINELKNIGIEDLLGREPVKVDLDSILEYVQNKVILITGGGGSIGSEICRQISSHQPKQLIIVDIYENSVYDLQQELLRNDPDLNLEVLIASVRDEERMRSIFAEYHPDIVYHAAAHKHVPLMETSPNEAIKNNVLGTYNVVKVADEFGVKKFIQISTDKAVNPTNIMGASKRICEMIIQTYNKRSKTEYVAVRFGNVLGSNGSVVPLFKQQIANGGPITVTHPEIIRYFMTIPEAVSLVLQAGAYAKGGEIFVLDMGEPVKIADLAKNMIRLAGLREGEDIDIVYTGLRPGEKLYEELLMEEEGMQTTDNQKIFIGKPIEVNEKKLLAELEHMRIAVAEESHDLRNIVKNIVDTYVLPEELEKKTAKAIRKKRRSA